MKKILKKSRKVLGKIKEKLPVYQELFQFIFISYFHAFSLRCVQNNTHNIKKQDILLFVTLRNEAFRMEHFFSYYRRLGVNHFFLVDNGSTDNFNELIKDQSDCSVWHTTASYKKSNFGMHWLNYLLRKYGTRHWCVVVDPDEFLVFPYFEQRNLHDLTQFLDNEKRESFFCLMLDMYGRGRIADADCRPGQDPLEVTPYFDANGYVQRQNPEYWEMFIQGGVRRRVLFNSRPERSPALNKIPLVKWKWVYSYISSMHCLLPKRLNLIHARDHLLPTGCLLHFKFLATLEMKAKEEMKRKEHYDGSIEYKQYYQFIEKHKDELYYSGSVKFENSTQLIQLELMQPGQWF